MLMVTLDASRLWMGIHNIDVWSLEILRVPSFFLYAADPLMFAAALEGVILQDQILSDSIRLQLFRAIQDVNENVETQAYISLPLLVR
jgi:hypothetical protein